MKRISKTGLLAFACLLLISSQGWASQILNSGVQGGMANVDEDHMVQFGVEDGLELYWGHRVSDTGRLGKATRMRYGFDLSNSYVDSESAYDQDGHSFDTEGSSNSSRATLHADMLFPHAISQRASLYWGIGPQMTWQHSYSEGVDEYPHFDLGPVTNTQTTDHFAVGARLLVGGDYALSSNVSLFVESSLVGGHAWWETVYDRSSPDYDPAAQTYYYMENDQTWTRSEWSARLDGVTVGVSFYY